MHLVGLSRQVSRTLVAASIFAPGALSCAYSPASQQSILHMSSMASTKIHNPGTDDGWHGIVTPDGPFTPRAGRYHLYIGLFCPFAHRANLLRHLKGLQDIIPVSILKPYPKGDSKGWPGWRFPSTDDEYPGATTDKLFGREYLHDVYFRADPEYKGRYSVPALWDTETNTLVNNESTELMRWLGTAFDSILAPEFAERHFYPEHLAGKIDEVAAWMQTDLNRGVYKAGFSDTQEEYEKNIRPVFEALNKLEMMIHENGGPYVLGTTLTELDIQLYPTIVRFDTVYHSHFKCNLGNIRHNYPVLNNWLRNLYWNVEGFKESTNFKHIKENYTKSHLDLNPKGITPLGPVPHVEEGVLDFSTLKPGRVALEQPGPRL